MSFAGCSSSLWYTAIPYQALVQKAERLGGYCWRKSGHTDTPTSAYHYCPPSHLLTPPPSPHPLATSLWGLQQITTWLCCNRTVSFTAYSHAPVNAFALWKTQIFWSCWLRVVVFSLLFFSLFFFLFFFLRPEYWNDHCSQGASYRFHPWTWLH